MEKQINIRGVRTRLIFLPLFSFFLIYILIKFLIPDFFVKENQLTVDRAIIKDVYPNKYLTYEKYKGKVYKDCVDIILYDKPYFIRFTDRLIENYWATIYNKENISKVIEVKYVERLLHDGILNNPDQLAINNRIIIPYNAKKTFTGWFAIAAATALIICFIIMYFTLRTYKRHLYKIDKEIGRKSKIKLFWNWIWE